MTGFDSKRQAAMDKLVEIQEELGMYDDQKPDQEPDELTIAYMSGLYDAPPKRTWVGLTAEEAAECWTTSATQTWKNFEAKLKEKNT